MPQEYLVQLNQRKRLNHQGKTAKKVGGQKRKPPLFEIAKSLTGKKFSRLTLIDVEKRPGSRVYGLFKCICTKEKWIYWFDVEYKKTKSCGCMSNERRIRTINQVNINHGRSLHGKSKTRIFKIWCDIVKRCTNSNMWAYKYYGGRGIKIDWKNFDEFYMDMNDSHEEHLKKHGIKNTTIDRVDNNKNYSKDNCKWSTRREQSRNRNFVIERSMKG